ncbi:MAG TPA: transposase [Labilithrix sp.]|nr:transposase [Labilithrix sp.]
MTAPRRILPGATAMITRRCTQRQYFLRPDEETNRIFNYCIAEAASRYEIGLIAWVVMSNHYHAVVYDPKGQLPKFIEHLHKMLARVLNARWGRWENLWATEETCITYLATPADVFRKVLYVLSNPFAEHVVDRLVDWPGSSSISHLAGKRTTECRPDAFFRVGGVMPESVELQTMLPPDILAVETAASWEARMLEAIAEQERTVRKSRMEEGRSVLGRKAVLSASPFDSPSTREPRRQLRPTIAAQDREQRIAELKDLREFRIAHDMARRRFNAGEHDIEFPIGTYRMRLWGARCATTVPIAA